MSGTRQDAEALKERNRGFYDPLWSEARLVPPQRFNTWPLVESLLAGDPPRLEVAPGLRPRLPLEGTHFVDFSQPAVTRLNQSGGLAAKGSVDALPFADGQFACVCALDIVEHVDDDIPAFHELARVLAPDGVLLLSAPLYAEYWTAFDDFVGHRRRYEPADLVERLERHDLTIEQSAIFGMRPRSSFLLDVGMWFLTHQRQRAMWWYNKIFMPLGVRFQKPLELHPGLVDTDGVDEIILVCRKGPG